MSKNSTFRNFSAKKFVLSMIICIFAPSVPTKPLNDAQMRGAFLFIYVHYQNTYNSFSTSSNGLSSSFPSR